jgi:hypothetical protein
MPGMKKEAPAPEVDVAAQRAFDAVVDAFRKSKSITLPAESRGAFGSNGIKVDGKIFAMLSRGALVVKLPKDRVTALVGEGRGKHFDPGHGRLMKEWLSLLGPRKDWLDLAKEAHAFVSATRLKKDGRSLRPSEKEMSGHAQRRTRSGRGG